MRRSTAPRPAALLTALVTVLLMVVAPAGLPGARTAAAEPTPTPTEWTPAIQPGVDLKNSKDLDEIAQKFVRNPLGEWLVQETNALGYDVGYPNIQVAFFSFSWMETDPRLPVWVRDKYRVFMAGLNQEIHSPSTKPRWTYPLRAQMLDGENYLLDDLFKTLEQRPTDSYGNEQVLSLTTGSVKGKQETDPEKNRHSEDAMDEWVTRILEAVLTRMAPGADSAQTEESKKEIKEKNKEEIDKVIKAIKSEGRALVGPRTYCNDCKKNVPENGFKFKHVKFLAPYDKYKSVQAELTSKNLKVLKPRLQAAYDQRIKSLVNQGLQNLNLAAPCPDLKNPGGMNIAAAAVSVSHPCDQSSNVLTKTLGSPAYGGVDLSNLQLRYLSDNGGGVKYAFSSQAAEKGLTQNPSAASQALVGSMADLRTWLALSPDKFWVNLNPNQPDRIIDKDLGQTNAGRALLEADWRMKQTEGKLLDPNTSFGAEYWRRLGGSGGESCYSSRMWIVPGEVEVRQDGSSLYVLKANLNVKAKAEQVAGLGTNCNSDPQQTARNAQLEQEMVVPKIEKEVNSAPEYAPLRRAFLARVVAQWLLDRHAAGHATSFDKLIGSGNLGPAVAHGSWRPQQVYDEYVRSIRNGTFTYRRTEHVGNTTLTYVIRTGGVDFSNVTSTRLSGADMNRKVPGLSQTIASSANRPATAADGSIWLGDTAKAPRVSSWDRVRSYFLGRTGLLVLLGIALLALLFFVRDGSALRRRSRRVP
ncbi:hypothetical protein [Streptomyces sp. NPDC001678]|uniref:hypothetical protein n=1 Tax=Streptomyces sp. NPDC001678 TaxID=3364599 RepID=UPI003676939D